MADPLAFKPPAVSPRTELDRRVAAAPKEHGEALLAAWDLLETAHDQGILDALQGLIYARDHVFATLADYSKLPESTAALRNLISLAKILGSIDPEVMEKVSGAMVEASEEHGREEKPPTLWKLIRRVNTEDSRRGLSLLTLMVSGLGRSLR